MQEYAQYYIENCFRINRTLQNRLAFLFMHVGTPSSGKKKNKIEPRCRGERNVLCICQN